MRLLTLFRIRPPFTLYTMLPVCVAVLFAACLLADDDKKPKPGQPPTPYNPYPPGILPADLVSEIARVRREVNLIFGQTLIEARALPPLTFTGLPPTIQGNGYRGVRLLGKLMNFD